MNTEKAKQVPVEQVLHRMGLSPEKRIGFDVWYKSPFREEKTPSFKVNTKINRWYDHGEGFGGNTLDLVIKKSGCNVSEALQYLKDFNVFFSFQKQVFETSDQEDEYVDHIEKIIPIQHLALIQYLKSRGITKYQKANYLKEIHYSIKDKKYFALGFRNNSGGFEVRSKYAKICLGVKDVSLIKNEKETLRIFEGFFDYLSFIQNENLNEESDYLILNSVALIAKNISILNDYKLVELYLDNDQMGDKYTNVIKETFQNSVDCRIIFKGFKDFNEWFSICELEVL